MQQSRLKRVEAALAALATTMAIFWGVWDHLHPRLPGGLRARLNYAGGA